ncbi:hypothetical protein AAGG74_16200 [Bacillus mexicanus]|uniref:hypothetical protein n=1 Tax=Bacillus mexicanus TaxID=2834415 RepID=UPI003D23696C
MLKQLKENYLKAENKSWITEIIEPLGEELAKRYGLKFEIYGPFGLNHRTSIYLFEDKNKRITEQKTKHITIQPRTLSNEEVVLSYETGKKKNDMENVSALSTAGLNGFDNETKILPDSIEEIMSIINQIEKTMINQ